ncbi:MAG: diguanylate cyclase [Coriobacteriia bacterium]|nr:diguanylate cyclase [Coriobacteriia bacterium]
MTQAPLSVAERPVSPMVVAGFVTLAACFVLAPSVAPVPSVGAAVRLAAYVLPAVLALVMSLRVARRLRSSERRVWLGIAVGAGGFALSTLAASSEVIGGVVPPWPWLSALGILGGAFVTLVATLSISGFRVGSWAVVVRHVVDFVAVGVLAYVAGYAFVWRHLAALYPPSVPAEVTVVGPLFSVLGLGMLAGMLVNYAGRKLRKRSRWGSFIAVGLGLAGGALFFWPLWYLGAVVRPALVYDDAVQLFWMAGAYALFVAGRERLAAPADGRDLAGMPRMRPRSHMVPGIIVPVVYTALIPLFFWLAFSRPEGGQEASVYLGVGVTFAIVLAARSALTAIENGHLFSRAVSDPVTQLLGHRYFHERLACELDLAERHREELGVVVIDIDDFSRVNSVCGHAGGDTLLRALASEFAACCRASDTVCRLGGDEFGMILPDAGERGVLEVCERIRNRLGGVKTPDGRPATASMGVALYPRDATVVAELLRRADGAQYWAKYHGKNAVVFYDSEVVEALDADERIRKLEEQSELAAVRALAAAVDARDSATQYHSRNVAALAVRVAQSLELSHDTTRLLEVAALLHDVGKIAVADAILRKKGALTAAERRDIEEHPALGEKILASNRFDEILPWVRGHHERWDGAGYPDGLAGEDIPLEARILALCDAYDAMTSERPYRNALSTDAAIQELDLCIGTQFDPALADVFIRMVSGTRRSDRRSSRMPHAAAGPDPQSALR